MNLSTFIITVSPDPGRGSITTYFSENWYLFTKFNKRRRNLSIELKIKKVTEFLPSIDLSCLGHGWILGAFQETGSSRKNSFDCISTNGLILNSMRRQNCLK